MESFYPPLQPSPLSNKHVLLLKVLNLHVGGPDAHSGARDHDDPRDRETHRSLSQPLDLLVLGLGVLNGAETDVEQRGEDETDEGATE